MAGTVGPDALGRIFPELAAATAEIVRLRNDEVPEGFDEISGYSGCRDPSRLGSVWCGVPRCTATTSPLYLSVAGPRWSRRIPTRITNGIGHGHARVFMKTIGDKAAIPKVRTPHRIPLHVPRNSSPRPVARPAAAALVVAAVRRAGSNAGKDASNAGKDAADDLLTRYGLAGFRPIDSVTGPYRVPRSVTTDNSGIVLPACCPPRRTGSGRESEETAVRPGPVDGAIVPLAFQRAFGPREGGGAWPRRRRFCRA